jgi:hypothetical protein
MATTTPDGDSTATKGGAARDKEQPAPKQTPVQSQVQSGPVRLAPADGTEQLIFTMRIATGEIVKVEKIDVGGKRQDISHDEIAEHVEKKELSEIENALDEAFEAGITGVLDPGSEFEEISEADEDEIALRRALLTLIIGAGARRRLQRRLVQRLILSRAAR